MTPKAVEVYVSFASGSTERFTEEWIKFCLKGLEKKEKERSESQ
jgi:hypothetical protein